MNKSNTEAEMKRKRREYFAAGARLVWLVYPRSRTVRVYTSPTDPSASLGTWFRTFTEEETLDGGDVLPGFQFAVKEWFERAERRLGR